MVGIVSNRAVGPAKVDPPGRSKLCARRLSLRQPFLDRPVAAHLPRRQVAQPNAEPERRVLRDSRPQTDLDVVGMRSEDQQVHRFCRVLHGSIGAPMKA